MRSTLATFPPRHAILAGFRYRLAAVSGHAPDEEAADVNRAAGFRFISGERDCHGGGRLRYHVSFRAHESGAPARVRHATDAQASRWPELAAWRGSSRPWLLWQRVDDAGGAWCADDCPTCADRRASLAAAGIPLAVPAPAPAPMPTPNADEARALFATMRATVDAAGKLAPPPLAPMSGQLLFSL